MRGTSIYSRKIIRSIRGSFGWANISNWMMNGIWRQSSSLHYNYCSTFIVLVLTSSLEQQSASVPLLVLWHLLVHCTFAHLYFSRNHNCNSVVLFMGNQTEENWLQLWELVFSQNESVQTVLLGGSDEFLLRALLYWVSYLRLALYLSNRRCNTIIGSLVEDIWPELKKVYCTGFALISSVYSACT